MSFSRLSAATVCASLTFTSVALADNKLIVPLPEELLPRSNSVTITGTLTQGAECPAIRGDSGEFYSLVMPANPAKLQSGAHVRIRGHRADVSVCMQGPTIIVDDITETLAHDVPLSAP